MKSTWEAPYKFNGKELDSETGMYYYGARYYTPELSIWLSVDPMADDAPNISPYTYCSNNPIIRIDPDGNKDRKLGPNESPGDEHRGSNIGRTTATIRSNRVVGYSNEHYGKIERAPQNVSLSITGKMRNTKLGDVNVHIDAQFSDGQRSTASSYSAVAGGFGNGAPENGNYTVNNYSDRSPKSNRYKPGMNKDSEGFSFDLNPLFNTNRFELRIHPDGNNEGTEGCVGLTGNRAELREFKNVIRNSLKNQNSVQTTININNNPNNNGKNSKHKSIGE